MKKIILLAIVLITGCILAAGCLAQSKIPEIKQTTVPVESSTEILKGPLIISIGEYNANLPVYIDNTSVGEVSPGKPLNLSVNEGHRAVKVCDGKVCEQVDVDIQSAIKTSLDFGERLIRDVPKGQLSVSIGDFIAHDLPVYLDDTRIGEVSPGKPLNLSVNEGSYTVRVCSGSLCKQQEVEIKATKQTTVDFEALLAKEFPQGPLTISISGYNAELLPVYIDDTVVGEVSQGKPLNLMVNEGGHTVRVCVGVICANKSVDIKFAQPAYVDFGERLRTEVEFPKPAVRILSSFLSGNQMTVNIEFINPEKLTIS